MNAGILFGPCNQVNKERGLIREKGQKPRRFVSSPRSFFIYSCQQFKTYQQRKKEAEKEIFITIIILY